MIEIKNLTKKFKSHIVLKNISITFDNKTYGLLGENGAGKTTLLRCITGMYSNYDGKITALDSDNNKSIIGYLPQNFSTFKELTVNDMMLFFANQKALDLNNISKEIDSLLHLVNLAPQKGVKTGKLSGGMLRRLGIAQALLGNPQIIILDEPTAGLDPEERLRFKNLVESIRKDKTVILSTHIVEDVDALCDEIIIVKGGEILFCGDTDSVRNLAQGKVFEAPESIVKSDIHKFETVKQYQKDNVLFYRFLTDKFDENYSVLPQIEDGYICAVKNI